jgi:hypothetical protein
MSTDANRREFALIEAASHGDAAAAHALLDHLRDQVTQSNLTSGAE